MRIKRFKRFDLLYRIAINPLLWIAFVGGLIYFILTAWWEREKEGEYWVYKLRSPRYEFSKMVEIFFTAFFNLWFWNEKYAQAYTNWWLYRYLILEVDNGYHRPFKDPKDEGSRIEGNTVRERVLNLYWKIYTNHRTIWNKKSPLYRV